MSLLIRPAIQSDVNAICDMTEAKRQQYAKWQPVFHKPAEGAREKQKPFFAGNLHSPETIILVADDSGSITGCVFGRLVDAPPVYNPGGKVLLVDDFVVADQASWSSVGKQLLSAVWERAQAQGAVLLNVICGPRDEPKRALMQEMGMTVATEWWVKPK